MFDLSSLWQIGGGALKGAQGVAGLYGSATGGGSPVGAGIGAAGSAAKLAGGVNDLSQAAGYGTAIPGVNYVAGPLGLAAGGYQLAEGDLTGIGSLYGGALATTAAAGQLAGGTAAGATAATAAGTQATTAGMMAGALNPVTAALGVFLAIGLMNLEHQKAARIKNQTIESGKIRQGGVEAVRRLQPTAGLAHHLENLSEVAPEQQGAGLDAALEAFRRGLDGHHVAQQLLATRGQGGAVSRTQPLSDPQIDAVRADYYPALRDTQVGFTRAADAQAQRGDALPDWATQGFGTYDPAALLHSMSAGDQGTQAPPFNAYWDVDYSRAVPGTLGTFLPGELGARDPGFAGGPLEQRFTDIGALNLSDMAPLTDPQIAQAAGARTALAEQVGDASRAALTDTSGQAPAGVNTAMQVAYSAPYQAGGSEQAAREMGLDPDLIEQLRAGSTDWQMALIVQQQRNDARLNQGYASANFGG